MLSAHPYSPLHVDSGLWFLEPESRMSPGPVTVTGVHLAAHEIAHQSDNLGPCLCGCCCHGSLLRGCVRVPSPSLTGVGKNEIIATNRPCHLWTSAYAGMIEWAW